VRRLFSFAREEEQVITGKRTFLRSPRLSDQSEWAALRQRSRAFLEKWEPSWQPDEFSRAAFRFRLRVYAQRARDDQSYTFFIFNRETQAMMGGLSLSHVRRGVSQSATLGYWMGLPYAGQGYMKDALLAVIAAGHPLFGLHRLEAACIPHNHASRHLLLACGFDQEGYARSYVKIAGRWEDHLLFGRSVDGA
jgi:ribosomal-protein-alanine N-acetyltransferase